ncbi:MAG: hypothetical protein R3320_01850 [Nitriliruptorales bacterium]|nr:hypothetical protein [Nitriliruptorales bacterium]
MRVLTRIVAGLALLTVASLFAVLPAVGQEDYPPVDGPASGPDTVSRGGEATFEGEGFEPDATVAAEVRIDSAEGQPFVRSETLGADGDGAVVFSFEVPCSVVPGDTGTVLLEGQTADGQTLTLSADFAVDEETAGCADPASGASDGFDLTVLLWILAAILLLGSAVVLVSRRRTTTG